MNEHLSEDDLALFALALLTPEEAAAANAHLRQCEGCRDEVARLQGDLVAYAFSAEMQDPPAAARTRLLDAVAAEPRKAVPVLDTSAPAPFTAGGTLLSMPAPEERSSRRSMGAAGWAGWAVAAGLAAFAGWEFTQTEHAHEQLAAQSDQLSTQSAQLAAQNGQLTNQNAQLAAQHGQLTSESAKAAALGGQLSAQSEKLAAQNDQLASKGEKLAAQNQDLASQSAQLASLNAQLNHQAARLDAQQAQLTAKDALLEEQTARVQQVAADAAHAQRVLHALTDPAAMQVALHLTGAAASAPPKPEGHASYNAATGSLVFVGTHLEQIKADKTYELWVLPASGAAPVAAGTFRPDANGNASVLLPSIPKGVAAKGFGITVENAGGSASPTLPIVLAGT